MAVALTQRGRQPAAAGIAGTASGTGSDSADSDNSNCHSDTGRARGVGGDCRASLSAWLWRVRMSVMHKLVCELAFKALFEVGAQEAPKVLALFEKSVVAEN